VAIVAARAFVTAKSQLLSREYRCKREKILKRFVARSPSSVSLASRKHQEQVRQIEAARTKAKT
jgi:hypothetical protein